VAEQPADALGRWLVKADRLLMPLENSLNFIGGALVFGLMVLGVVQIVLRTLFRAPIFGYIDIVEFSMVGFAILGISYVQRLGGHVRMEVIVGHFHGRALWILEAFGSACAIFIIAVIIPYAYRHFERALNFGDSTIDIELPTWPAKLAVPIMLSVLLVRTIVQLLGYLRLVADPDAQPVAIPLIKSVSAQAEEELKGAT